MRIQQLLENWLEWYDTEGTPRIGVLDQQGKIRKPDHLYRVMSRREFDQAEALGEFRPRAGQRIHASSQPQLRYADPGGHVVVRFRYEDRDGWRAKWGDELYAVTDQPIPFDRAEVVTG